MHHQHIRSEMFPNATYPLATPLPWLILADHVRRYMSQKQLERRAIMMQFWTAGLYHVWKVMQDRGDHQDDTWGSYLADRHLLG